MAASKRDTRARETIATLRAERDGLLGRVDALTTELDETRLERDHARSQLERVTETAADLMRVNAMQVDRINDLTLSRRHCQENHREASADTASKSQEPAR